MLRSRVKSKKSIPTPLLAGQSGKVAKRQSDGEQEGITCTSQTSEFKT